MNWELVVVDNKESMTVLQSPGRRYGWLHLARRIKQWGCHRRPVLYVRSFH